MLGNLNYGNHCLLKIITNIFQVFQEQVIMTKAIANILTISTFYNLSKVQSLRMKSI